MSKEDAKGIVTTKDEDEKYERLKDLFLHAKSGKGLNPA
jgi:hypothetical protein